jgi:hypothetical protein
LNSGSKLSGASGASAAVTVELKVAPKFTVLPWKVLGACACTKSMIFVAYAGSLGGGVCETTEGSGAGKVLPLILVYGSRPGSSRFSVATEPSGCSCMTMRWKIWTLKPSSLKVRDTG